MGRVPGVIADLGESSNWVVFFGVQTRYDPKGRGPARNTTGYWELS